jgi:hypothetical protein
MGFCLLVLAGCSLLDQPRLLMLSLKDDEAILGGCGGRVERRGVKTGFVEL